MVSRRILTTLTLLSALLLVASLGLVAHSQGGRADQSGRIELTRGLATAFDEVGLRTTALADAADLLVVREARQEMARAVLRFDQDLLTLAETVKDRRASAAVGEIQRIWRELGLDLADLAAGEYAASSAAGRETLAHLRRQAGPLRQHLQDVTAALHGAEQDAGRRSRQATTAAVVFGGLGLLCGVIAYRPQRPAAAPPPALGIRRTDAHADADDRRPDTGGAGAALTGAATGVHTASPPAAPLAATRRGPIAYSRPEPPFSARGDLGLASAAVDRVTVDMLTITRSTERMQQAVDSVTASLQGMLFSLNDLAQDTHEGARITRTANNAAAYAADTARELLETAREMGTVVARVRSLAARSQEIAGRIESEAAATGATGEAFTSVVAQEVKQLATATSDATAHIEATVDEILTSQRQYEEAIGQIIKNLGLVRKVAAGLGELMLEPPSRVQPGPAYRAAAAPPEPATAPAPPADLQPSPDPAAEPVPAETASPLASALDADELELETITPEEAARIEELNAVTESLLDELAEVAAEATPAAASASEPAPVPETASIAAAAPDVAPSATPTDAPAGSDSSVFMLNKPRPASTQPPAPAAAPAADDEEQAPAAAAEPPAPEPEPQPEPSAPAEAEPVGAGAGSARSRPQAQGASGNIFMLNEPKK
jgi:hypothetical protein